MYKVQRYQTPAEKGALRLTNRERFIRTFGREPVKAVKKPVFYKRSTY